MKVISIHIDEMIWRALARMPKRFHFIDRYAQQRRWGDVWLRHADPTRLMQPHLRRIDQRMSGMILWQWHVASEILRPVPWRRRARFWIRKVLS